MLYREGTVSGGSISSRIYKSLLVSPLHLLYVISTCLKHSLREWLTTSCKYPQ
jgi:hypothetical protein